MSTTTQFPQTTETSAMQTVDSYDHSLMSLSFAVFLLAIVLFVSSLFLPVFITQTNDIQGYWVLAMGWLGFIAFQFAWYASPFAMLAVYVSRRSPQLGLLLSVIAILMASEAFLFSEVPFGRNDKVLDYGLGFYLWYLCFYLVSLSILLRLVAWGRVEETLPEPQIASTDQFSEQDKDSNTEFLPQIATTSTVKRIIIPKKEKNKNKELQNSWQKKTPPPLPQENIYKTTDEALTEEKVSVQPPPIPKKKRFSNPPPLPKWYRNVSSPPPLPVKRDLDIAPFLKK